MNRDQALSQLGLPDTATQDQIRGAYEAAIAELDALTQNLPGQSLSSSFRNARDDLERAHQVLRRSPEPKPPEKAAPPEKSSPSSRATASAPARGAWKGPGGKRKSRGHQKPPKPAPVPGAVEHEQLGEAAGEIEAARAAVTAARREMEEAREAIDRLRAEAKTWHAEVERLATQARGLRKGLDELRAEAQRELEAIRKARRVGDEAVKSLYRSEEEANAAATHAQAYRDGAMYAAQAVEKLLRELRE